jgi:hypothetical protein
MASLLERCAWHEAGHCCAALVYNIPILSVSIDTATPRVHRAHYRAPADIALEAMCVLCLAGPSSEEFFCGKIDDGSDRTDIAIAREYLSRQYDALQIGFQLKCFRDAADALVRTPSVQDRIRWIGVCNTRLSLAGAVAIVSTLACSKESLP